MAFGGGSYTIDQVRGSVCIVQQYSEDELVSSALMALLGFLLAEDAYDEYKETTDDLEEINQRRLDMAKIIHAHQLEVTHPFLKYAMDEAFNFPVPTPDYGGMCSFFKNEMMQSLGEANTAQGHYSELFCIEPAACNNELGYYAGLAAVDGAYARARQQERREEIARQTQARVIQQAHAGTMRSPNAIFGLLDNAAQIYGYLQQQAWGNLNGSLAMFGYGLQGIAGAFGRGGGT